MYAIIRSKEDVKEVIAVYASVWQAKQNCMVVSKDDADYYAVALIPAYWQRGRKIAPLEVDVEMRELVRVEVKDPILA